MNLNIISKIDCIYIQYENIIELLKKNALLELFEKERGREGERESESESDGVSKKETKGTRKVCQLSASYEHVWRVKARE